MATAPIPLGGAEETAGAGHRAHHSASQQLVRGWRLGQGGVRGNPGAVRGAEGGHEASRTLSFPSRLLSFSSPILSSQISLCVFISASFLLPLCTLLHFYDPPPRFINARRRIVQPMIDQSNRTGTRSRWEERAWYPWGSVKAQTQASWGSSCTPQPPLQDRVQPSAQRASLWGATPRHSHT